MIHGIDVILIKQVPNGTDEFNAPIYKSEEILVHNVLVAPLSSSDITSTTDLNSDVESYQLGIPKGDMNEWRDNFVKFWGKTFKVIGVPTQGIEDMIPLSWNKKVNVELYE